MIGDDELRRRLVAEEWLLRNATTLMEFGPVKTRCKLCEEEVERDGIERHWRGHVRQRESMRRQAERRAYTERVRRLEKARAMRKGSA